MPGARASRARSGSGSASRQLPRVRRSAPCRWVQAEYVSILGEVAMNIGIIGSGAVGRTLGAGFVSRGHKVIIGSREPDRPELVEWREAAGDGRLDRLGLRCGILRRADRLRDALERCGGGGGALGSRELRGEGRDRHDQPDRGRRGGSADTRDDSQLLGSGTPPALAARGAGRQGVQLGRRRDDGRPRVRGRPGIGVPVRRRP